MFLHLLSPHIPWRHYDDLPQWGPTPADQYDSCITRADQATGRFLEGLRERGIYDEAVIVVTADHGTGLGDHGRLGGFLPYEEQTHVPLIIRVPGVAPRRVSEPVVGIDLAPTLLSLVEPGAPSGFDGFSLTPLMSGRVSRLPRRYLFSHSAFEDAIVVQDIRSRWKLTLHRTRRYTRLVNLDEDRLERRIGDDPEVHSALLRVALGYLELGRGTWGNPYHYRAAP